MYTAVLKVSLPARALDVIQLSGGVPISTVSATRQSSLRSLACAVFSPVMVGPWAHHTEEVGMRY